MKLIIILIIIFFTFSFQTFAAKIVIISDIDDTIKASHMLAPTKGAAVATFIEAAFPGMSNFYQKIKDQHTANGIEVKFYYVTNAPKVLMKNRHTKFLKYNSFPEGEIMFSKLGDKHHKIKSIEKVFRNENPDELLLIGDNGIFLDS